MPIARRRPLVLGAVLALIAAGCGSGADSDSSAASGTTDISVDSATATLSSDGTSSADATTPVKPLTPAERTAVRGHIETVRECLEEAGLEARGGFYDRSPDDADAPDGELIDTRGTFIAFYASESRAEELTRQLDARATELAGTLTRHGKVSVLYAKLPEAGSTGEPDDRIEDCAGE